MITMNKLTITILEDVMSKMESINKNVTGIEYHDKNTLPDPQKRMHREVGIPMMEESMNEIRKEFQNIVSEMKKEGITEIELSDEEHADMQQTIKMVDMYKTLTVGIVDLMDEKIDETQLGNQLVDNMKDIYK